MAGKECSPPLPRRPRAEQCPETPKCIYIYTYIHKWISIYIYIYTHIYTYIHVNIYIYIYIYIYTYVYIRMRIVICTHTHTHTYTYTSGCSPHLPRRPHAEQYPETPKGAGDWDQRRVLKAAPISRVPWRRHARQARARVGPLQARRALR